MNAQDEALVEALVRQAEDRQNTPFDYVIVGSGAGGGPLAARLAQNGRRVLLIEAGNDPAVPEDPNVSQPMGPAFRNDPAMREVYAVPAFHAASTEDKQMSWGFSVRHYGDTKRQKLDSKYKAAEDPSGHGGIFYPRTAAIGGCTAHYAMIIIRPNDADWDQIARHTGDESWRSEKMQGYFGKIENCLYYSVYESAIHKFLGVLFKLVQGIAIKIDPRNQLDPGGHGFKGWQKTSFIDPLVILNIVRDDKTFVGVLKDVILAALENRQAGKMFLQAASRLQLLRYLDPNVRSKDVPTRDHISLISIGTDGRRRCGLPDYLREVKEKYKDNLVILHPVHATRILFEKGKKAPRAIGVEVLDGAHLYDASATAFDGSVTPAIKQVFAKHEVIVCGGAFNTPQLLMLSGIGERAHLKKIGIAGLSGPNGYKHDIVDLHGVGKNLQDRYEVSVICEANKDFTTLNGVHFRPGDKNDPVLDQWSKKGTGLYATNGGAIAMMLSSPVNATVRRDPDFFVFGVPASFRGYYWDYSKELLRNNLTGAESQKLWSWVILKAYTNNNQGTVYLQNRDPLKTPDINFHSFDDTDEGKLTCESDVDALCWAVEHMRQINARVEAFRNGNEVQPPEAEPDDPKTLRDWVKNEAWGHHACGTCRMGPDVWQADTGKLEDKEAVVDSQFRVHGVEDLRIVDTSVFWKIPGYFIVTPTFMISEKAADLLLADTASYPHALEKDEADAIRKRREQAGITASHPGANNERLPHDTVGLALSGGGIRSGTFCLGFLQALAAKGRLRDIDMITSVSGGGYVASFLGRLFSRLQEDDHDKAARIERTLANADSPENQWLRYNAQYILGGGRHDALWDIAVILRNLISVHLWLGVLIFAILGLLHMWVLDCARLGFLTFACHAASVKWFNVTLSPWWWLPAAMFLLAVLPPSIGYWLTLKNNPGRDWRLWRLWLPFVLWIVLLASAICGMSMPRVATESTVALVVLLLAWFAQEAASWHMKRAPDAPPPGTPKAKAPPPNPGVANPAVGTTTVRNRLTRMLGAALFGFLISVLWVALDTLAPVIAKDWFSPAAWSMAGIAPLLLLLRGVAAGIIKSPAQASVVAKRGFALQILLGVVAFVLIFTLVLFVDVLVYQLFRFEAQVGRLCTMASLVVSVVLGSMLSYLNLSSLQQAYAQKLTRTFLGAANDARVHPAGNASPVPIDVPDLGDDIWFDEYHPEANGGPLHLICSCVDNTVDPLSGNQLRDDKGMPICAGPMGLSVGRRFHALWKPRPDGALKHVARVEPVMVEPDPNQFHVLARKDNKPVLVERLRLGQWMAISGAAATTGLGRETRLAQSALLGLFNIRIGYWWNSGIDAGDRPGRYPPDLWRWLKSLPAVVFRLQATLLNEWRAYFPGPAERLWYLSDGGHFDDTALYELFRRRVPFMIAVDASHDPTYNCDSLALLTRQVRFDFCAAIEWIDPAAGRRAARPLPAGWNAFTTQNGRKPPACLQNVLNPEGIGSYEGLKRDATLNAALAHVTYADDKDRESWLLLVKPSVSCGLPNDLRTYAARHGDFPNQTTLDQFFDDNQWEAYRMLGRCTGGKLFTQDAGRAGAATEQESKHG